MVQIARGVRKANSLYLKSSRVMSSQALSCKTQSCHKDKLILLSPTSLHPDISDISMTPEVIKPNEEHSEALFHTVGNKCPFYASVNIPSSSLSFFFIKLYISNQSSYHTRQAEATNM